MDHAQAGRGSDIFEFVRHDVGDALRELHRISLGLFELLFLAVELTIWSHREKLPQPLRPRATHVTHRIKRGNQLEALRRFVVKCAMPSDHPLALEMLGYHSKRLAFWHAARHRLLQHRVIIA